MKLDPYPKRKWYRLNRDKAIISPSPTAPHFECCISLSTEQTTNCSSSLVQSAAHRAHYYEIPKSEIRKPKTENSENPNTYPGSRPRSDDVFNLQRVPFQVRVRVQSLRKSLRCLRLRLFPVFGCNCSFISRTPALHFKSFAFHSFMAKTCKLPWPE